MKKILPIFMLLLCLFSCSNDDDVETTSFSGSEKEMLSSLQGTWVCEDEIFDTGVVAQTTTLMFSPFSNPTPVENVDGVELTFDGKMRYMYAGVDGNVRTDRYYYFILDTENKNVKLYLKNDDSETWSVTLIKDITNINISGNEMSCYFDGSPMTFVKK